MFNLTKKFCTTQGISGRERAIGEVIAEEIAPYVDEYHFDALGNLIAFKKGADSSKKLMFAAHMDEIGFMATFIEENGYIRFTTIGGINFGAAGFSHVVFENGTCGVLVPQQDNEGHERWYVDIGTKSRKETEKKISIGDGFAVESSVKKLAGSRVAGRPFDDRIGCAVMAEAARVMAKEGKTYKYDTYFAFTVQEEVGCRGSKTAAFAIMPDYGIAFDVTATGDSQGARPMAVKLGDGAAIKVKDSSVICDPELVKRLGELAEAKKIPHQYEILTGGGTDTSSMQMTGVGCSACCLSIPSRYIHSAVEVIDMKDVRACADLCVAAIEEL